jgi:acyl carrier protein
MSEVSAQEVRSFVLAQLDQPLRGLDLDPAELPDDFDLHGAGVIDSFGILELIGAVEERFSLEIDFEQLDPDDLTVIGPFSRFVEEQSRARAA